MISNFESFGYPSNSARFLFTWALIRTERNIPARNSMVFFILNRFGFYSGKLISEIMKKLFAFKLKKDPGRIFIRRGLYYRLSQLMPVNQSIFLFI